MKGDRNKKREPTKEMPVQRRMRVEPDTPPISGLRPPHLFVMLTMVAAGGGVVVAGRASPAQAAFVSLAVFSAGFASYLLYRTVWPLVARTANGEFKTAGNRDRAPLESERATLLRTIDDLEFDRAMGKLSEADFLELRAALDARRPTYRDLIERDLEARMVSAGTAAVAAEPAAGAGAVIGDRPLLRACGGCGTHNDPDAKFCKKCGNRLSE
jgi:hypothetical protein